MIAFWMAAALLAAAACGLMLLRGARGGVDAADPATGVYRRALTEIDDLAARGLLPAGEGRSMRAEAARRLLAASEASQTPVRAGGPAIPLAVAGAVAVTALGIYLAVGSPGLPDQPFAARLAAWRAHPEHYPAADLAAALAAIADEHPNDLEPLRRLAALDVSLGDAGGAIHALRKAMALAPGRADLPAMLGEVLVMQAQGAVTADARALFNRALSINPDQDTALYFLARARIADGDVAGGLAQWRGLLGRLPAGAAGRASLADEIAAVEKTGALPPDAQGTSPPQGDVKQAIRGMVDGLAARLAARPDDPAGWVRLVRAYAVLGETGKRDQAAAQARRRFASHQDVLGQINAAALTPAAKGLSD